MKNDVQKKGFLGEVIAVTNQKGGTGKTTFTINLSVALCELGYKVLCEEDWTHTKIRKILRDIVNQFVVVIISFLPLFQNRNSTV